MRTYSTNQELIAEIRITYKKLVAEFDSVPENLKDKRIAEVDRTPSEVLSYQLGWVNLMLNWEKDEKNGCEVHTPTPDYKWNNLGGLYQSYYDAYGNYSLNAVNLTIFKHENEKF